MDNDRPFCLLFWTKEEGGWMPANGPPSVPAPEDRTPLRLVIVEDSAEDAELIIRELRRSGFEPSVKRVDTEEAFVDSLATEPDVVICDYSVPGLDARRVLELLQERGDATPLIIVSGTIGEDTAVEVMRLGAADYLLKDRLVRLGSSIRRLLEQRRAEDERVRAVRKLRASEARYRSFVEQVPAIVYTWGVTGSLDPFTELYVSPQIRHILGFAPDEWLTNPSLWIDRLHPEDRDDVLAATTRSIERGIPFQLEYRMMAKDGRTVWLRDEAAVVGRDDTGRATLFQGVQIDITSRKMDEDERRRSAEQVQSLDRQRRELLGRLVTAQEAERRRIAADIHDDTIQVLAALSIRLDILSNVHPDLREDEQFLALRASVVDASARLRHLMFELHPRDLERAGIVATIRAHLFELGRSPEAPEYELRSSLSHEPSRNIQTFLYRILQEAIVNTRKHSRASLVTVTLEEGDGGFLARVEDDGSGFDVEAAREAQSGGFGLRSMRERAELAGGWWRIDSTPGRSTTIEAWLPDVLDPED
jgi:two-component system sensor histidine kinase UhpB